MTKLNDRRRLRKASNRRLLSYFERRVKEVDASKTPLIIREEGRWTLGECHVRIDLLTSHPT